MRKLILSGIVAVFACTIANAAPPIEGELKTVRPSKKDSSELFQFKLLVDGKEQTHLVSGEQEVSLHVGKTNMRITTAAFVDWVKKNPKKTVKVRLKIEDGKVISLITCVDGTPWP